MCTGERPHPPDVSGGDSGVLGWKRLGQLGGNKDGFMAEAFVADVDRGEVGGLSGAGSSVWVSRLCLGSVHTLPVFTLTF